jgi:hypothetical protein
MLQAVSILQASKARVSTFRRATTLALFACFVAPAAAAPQEVPAAPAFLERVRQALARPVTPGPRLDTTFRMPAATFKTRVDQAHMGRSSIGAP